MQHCKSSHFPAPGARLLVSPALRPRSVSQAAVRPSDKAPGEAGAVRFLL
ncbi:hypothetical protein HMPREF0262_00243 [Clostridium sp. ATCC 29733]|nr:hypothetical protein HMPREF0262_00243 [Clostridium sp. ATCC 29733]